MTQAELEKAQKQLKRRELALTLFEFLFCCLLVAGTALYSLPAGMILAGVLGVFAIERQSVSIRPSIGRRK